MKLYGFFRSGTSHRLRIALNLKGLSYEQVSVSLAKNQHHQEDFKALNPQGLVPVLETEQGLLTQSPAIIEWLEEVYPEVALLPKDPFEKAKVRALAAIVGCDIHPINNKRVLEYLRNNLGQDENQVLAWCAEWISKGFEALEALLQQDQTRQNFCYGNSATLADVYLIPQVYSAKRFKVDLTPYPTIVSIYEHCMQLEAFQKADPAQQADAI
ncbi:maleylacetoacetate isomerase [Acinetobacter sp. LoGeW2-3]|uniref:maleylacetoacetate isomerase n=1 Tax=Acinetobacter sp. LoGeW2-3 TaxID=1808001 RepID=UPI000C057FEE|nr:maleylacetoacetate isomerase [Acinetobacter sp. LoGeW2-3]ATO19243.1 maleylacetoacetate isomerase [Acinetobacter sp. LoGeW2-3]